MVSLADGTRIPLYAKEINAFGIHEEADISQDILEQIMQELLPKRAKLCAMHLLERQDRTEYQLRKKLLELFYPEEITEQAVAYVKAYHYIDDLRYAISYIEYRKDTKSLRQLSQELLQKGITPEIFAEAAAQIELPEEEAQIRRWMEKKHYIPGSSDQKERERMYRFLLRRGYSPQAIGRMMRMEDL